MRGVISAYALFHQGVYKVRIECRDRESFELVKRKLRLIGIFIEEEKGIR
jgi:hypothetical protein